MKKRMGWVFALFCIVIFIFILARFGWRVLGFNICVLPDQIYISKVDVMEDQIMIDGDIMTSALAYVGYICKREGESVYIGLKYNSLFGVVNRSGVFHINEKMDTMGVHKIYLKGKNEEKQIWDVNGGEDISILIHPDFPVKDITSDELRSIEEGMSYQKMLTQLGQTADLGSGRYIALYRVDGKYDLHLGFGSFGELCREDGEMLLERSIHSTCIERAFSYLDDEKREKMDQYSATLTNLKVGDEKYDYLNLDLDKQSIINKEIWLVRFDGKDETSDTTMLLLDAASLTLLGFGFEEN